MYISSAWRIRLDRWRPPSSPPSAVPPSPLSPSWAEYSPYYPPTRWAKEVSMAAGGKNHKWRCRGENWEDGREKGENWIRNGVECQLLSFILSVFLCFSFCLFLFLSVCLVLLLSLPLSWHQSIHILCSGWSVRPQVCWCNPRKVPVGCHGVHHRGARPPPQPQENGRERCYHRCLTTLLYWVSQKSVYLLLADTASERSDPGPYFSQRSYPDPHF